MSLSKIILQLVKSAPSRVVSQSLPSIPRHAIHHFSRTQPTSSLRWASYSTFLFPVASSSSLSFAFPRYPLASSSLAAPLVHRASLSSAPGKKSSLDPSQITLESQFQVVLRKTMKSLGEYVDQSETSTKKLRKILKRFNLLTKCKFSDQIPTEVLAFSFFLLSQLVQGRASFTEDLIQDMHHIFGDVLEARVADFKPSELARIFWAYSEIEGTSDLLVEKLCGAALDSLAAFDFQDIVNILIAFQKFPDKTPNAEFLTEASRHLLSKIDRANGPMLANMVCAVCASSVQPDIDLLNAAVARLPQLAHELNPRQSASVLYAIAPLHTKPEHTAQLQPLLDAVARDTQALAPRWITRLLGATSVLGLALSEELVGLLARRLEETTANVSPSTIADVLMSFGMLKLRVPEGLLAQLEAQALAKEYRFKGTSIGNLFIGYANLEVPIPEALFARLSRRALLTAADNDPEDILSVLQGFAELGRQVDGDFVQEMVYRAEDLLESPEEDLTIFFDVYAKLKELGGKVEGVRASLKQLTGYDADLPDEEQMQQQQQQEEEGRTTVVAPRDEEEEGERLVAQNAESEMNPAEVEDGFDEQQVEFEFLEPLEGEEGEAQGQDDEASGSDTEDFIKNE